MTGLDEIRNRVLSIAEAETKAEVAVCHDGIAVAYRAQAARLRALDQTTEAERYEYMAGLYESIAIQHRIEIEESAEEQRQFGPGPGGDEDEDEDEEPEGDEP